MNNRKFYSYDRNNYYYGKLLTSRDFSMEQGYMNDKRRLGNLMLHGSGIVSGLKAVAADETALILQAGFAIDGGGREIVVPETEVVKLATIEGVSNLHSDIAYLGISYQEKADEKVYAVMREEGQENESAYNHVKEGYKLFLVDEDACSAVPEKVDSWLTETVLFEDEDCRITYKVCKILPAERNLIVYTTIEKKRQTQELLSVKYVLNVDGLSEQKFAVEIDHAKLERYEKKTIKTELVLKDEVRFLKTFYLKVKNLEVRKDNSRYVTEPVAPVMITCLESDLLSAIVDDSFKTAMDTVIENDYDTIIYLAKLHVIRMGDRVLLNRLEGVPFGQYVHSAAQLKLFEDLKAYCPSVKEMQQTVVDQIPGAVMAADMPAAADNAFVTGTFDLSLGAVGDAGKVCYSEEIMHGLGEGPVYVEAAVEVLNRDNGEIKEEIIFGDADLFGAGEQAEKQLQFSCGVKLLPDRGTFIVAVKPKNKVARTSVRIRWYACKVQDSGKNIYKAKEKQGMLVIAPDTLTTAPRGIVQIVPRFVNIPEQACRYEVLDAAGGRIDNNGIYTAPTAEGVYEVKVSLISDPGIFAHAYIIVSANPRG